MTKLKRLIYYAETLACYYIILRGFMKLENAAKIHNGYLMIEAFVYIVFGWFVLYNRTKPVQKD